MSELQKVRISMDERDIGHMEDLVAHKPRIFVDGVENCYCMTADEVNGYVIALKREGDVFVLDGENVVEEIIRGSVKIEGLSADVREVHIERMANRRLMIDAPVEVAP